MNLTEMIALALELDGKATKGPWASDWGRVRDDSCETVCQHPEKYNWTWEKWTHDRDLIAEYRTLCPALAKACAEMEKEVKKCGDAINIHIDIEQRLEREKAALVKALETARKALVPFMPLSEDVSCRDIHTRNVAFALAEINKLTQ